MLRIDRLHTVLDTDHGLARVVEDLALTIERGETFALVGESGCEKLSVQRATEENTGGHRMVLRDHALGAARRQRRSPEMLNEFSERVNQQLRSIFMKTVAESLVAIISGVAVRRSWKSEGSPWYTFFDEVELSSLSREDAEALIRTPVEGVFRYRPEAVELILTMSELKPYLIQKFCIHAVNRMLEEGRTVVTSNDVEAVTSAVLFEGRSPLLAAEAQRAPA